MPARLATRVLAVAVAAGVVGAGLTAAGVVSPARAILVLVFLAVAPTAAIARLLGAFDPFARLIIACMATIAILSLIALIMLAWGVWSPLGGLLAVAAVTAACVVAPLPAVSRWLTAQARAEPELGNSTGPGRPEPGSSTGSRGSERHEPLA